MDFLVVSPLQFLSILPLYYENKIIRNIFFLRDFSIYYICFLKVIQLEQELMETQRKAGLPAQLPYDSSNLRQLTPQMSRKAQVNINLF